MHYILLNKPSIFFPSQRLSDSERKWSISVRGASRASRASPRSVWLRERRTRWRSSPLGSCETEGTSKALKVGKGWKRNQLNGIYLELIGNLLATGIYRNGS